MEVSGLLHAPANLSQYTFTGVCVSSQYNDGSSAPQQTYVL
jgi:hypothetical protein